MVSRSNTSSYAVTAPPSGTVRDQFNLTGNEEGGIGREVSHRAGGCAPMGQTASTVQPGFVDIVGLQQSSIWPPNRRPSIRTLREWSRLRKIPVVRLGHFALYDVDDVSTHLRKNYRIAPR